MAQPPPMWITLWFLLTTPVILWDVGYCFMRPRSMVGGDLHWIWEPYGIYQNVDLMYGLKALQENNGFTNAQSMMNVIETALNLVYVFTLGSPSAPVIGLCSAAMTLSKTILYWANDYFCGWCHIRQNTMYDLILYWIIPNGLWIIVPAFIVLRLYSDITSDLAFAYRAKGAKKVT